jgi:hypothetical protein
MQHATALVKCYKNEDMTCPFESEDDLYEVEFFCELRVRSRIRISHRKHNEMASVEALEPESANLQVR